MSDLRKGLGQAVINGLIRNSLFNIKVVMPDGQINDEVTGTITVWNPMAAEILEAIVHDFGHNSRYCKYCDSHALMGGGGGLRTYLVHYWDEVRLVEEESL